MTLAQRDRRSLVERTREDLVGRIRTGEFKPGQQLPSEPDLARAYSISRMTMREAIKGMQQEHLIETVRGRGTFVTHVPITRPVTRLQSGTELATDLGYALTTRVLEVRVEEAAGAIAGTLDVTDGTALLRLERLRLVDGQPALYSIDIFAASIAEPDRPLHAWESSLFAYIQQRTGLPITHTAATLRAEVLDAETTARIDALPGLAWFVMEQTNYTADNRPIMYSLDYHRGDLFSFETIRRCY